MEDELEQEGMEEEISPKKAKGGGKMKMIIVVVGLLVVGSVIAFVALNVFFPAEESTEEEPQEEVIEKISTEYGMEYILDPTITISLQDQNKRVRNLVVDARFETSSSGVAELTKRDGLVRDIIQKTILNFDFNSYVGDYAVQDSIKQTIVRDLKQYLPDGVKHLQLVYLSIVTM